MCAGVEVEVPKKEVFMLEWLDPPFDAGHWVPEIQQVLAGSQPGLLHVQISAAVP